MALCDWSRESRDRTTSTCSTCYKTVGTNNTHFNLKWLYYFCSFLTPKRKKKSYLYFSIFHRTFCFHLNVTHLVVGKIERQVKSNNLYSVANPSHSDRAISSRDFFLHSFCQSPQKRSLYLAPVCFNANSPRRFPYQLRWVAINSVRCPNLNKQMWPFYISSELVINRNYKKQMNFPVLSNLFSLSIIFIPVSTWKSTQIVGISAVCLHHSRNLSRYSGRQLNL